MKNLKILIIEDHLLMIEGYKSVFSNNSNFSVEIITTHNCENAYKIITKPNATFFDYIFLDLNLPPYHLKKVHSGKDLIVIIKKYLPKSKVVVLTSSTESFILYNIIKQEKPVGMLVKSDFTPVELLNAITQINSGGNYYSETVRKSINIIKTSDFYLDNYNRKIILLLSNGVKTKNLIKYIPLSLSTIEKRKAIIKDYFEILKGTDEDIVNMAKKRGFI